MFRAIVNLLAGQAFRHRELRLLLAAVFFSFLGSSLSFPLRLLYAQRHGASAAELGLMAGSFLLAPVLVQIPLGWLIDRWGRVPTLLLSLCVHPVLMALYIPLNSPVDLIALRFLEGITVAAFRPAVNAYIADITPEENRSEAYGALGATLNAAMFLGPVVGGVVAQTSGFGTAFVVNVIVEALAVPLVLGRVREPEVHRAPVDAQRPARWPQLFSAPLLTAYAGFFCFQAAMATLGALWSIWVHDLGGSYSLIGFTFSAFALPQIVLGTAAGRWTDRLGRPRLMLVAGVALAAIYASYGFMTNLVLITVMGVVEGVPILFQSPAINSFLADASPPDVRGRVQGVAGMAGALGGFGAAVLALPLYHVARELPFAMTGALALAGACVSAVGVRRFERRQQAKLRSEVVAST